MNPIFNKGQISRRSFLKASSIIAGGIGTGMFSLSKLLAQSQTYDMSIVSSRSIPTGILDYNQLSIPEMNEYNAIVGTLVEETLDSIGGLGSFISTGDKVVVKPNLGFAKLLGHGVCTDPAVVLKVVELAYNAGATEVIVTDNPCNAASLTFQSSGLNRALQTLGMQPHAPRSSDFVQMNLGGEFITQAEVFKVVYEADKVINIPIAKTHSLSKLTLGMKNLYGGLGGGRSRYHQRINESIADMANFFRPTLTIMDAVRLLTAGGPTGGNVGNVMQLNTLVASTDMIAVDSYTTTLFGMTPSDIGCISLGVQYGLGTSRINTLNVIEKTIG